MRPVLSNVEAPTFEMKLIVEPGVFGSGQNFSSAREMGSVTVARSAAVGTRVELTVGFTWRKPSHDAKKNVLSLRIGPPPAAPNWFRCSVFFVPPNRFVKKLVGSALGHDAHLRAVPASELRR